MPYGSSNIQTMPPPPSSRIYLSPPHMGGTEQAFVNDAFATNWIAPLGPNVDGFEQDIASYTGARHVAALSSGTAAIHLALILLGVKPGDYVICQSLTFSATANAIRYVGAIPVFVDSETETWNMCPATLELAIKKCLSGDIKVPYDQVNDQTGKSNVNKLQANKSEAGKSKNSEIGTPHESANSHQGSFQRSGQRTAPGKMPAAIIPVHLYGMPAQMDKIMAIANKYSIPVIEDAAEAFGSQVNGKRCGSIGHFGILSFNGNKIITTSGGGALLSDDGIMIGKARHLATQARDPAPHYQHSELGYNYRMSNVLAGIGRGQMQVLDERISQRRANHSFYMELLQGKPGISFLHEPHGYFSNRWLTTIQVDPQQSAGITRENIRLALETENIESRPIWKPMHQQPVFEQFPYYGNGVSDKLFEQGLCLPSGSGLDHHDKTRIAKALGKAL